MAKHFVANWKMNMSHVDALDFVRGNLSELEQLIKKHDARITLCPSFTELSQLIALTKKSSVSIGAQTCSSHESGAYTGQVSATSIAQVGCTFCLAGHSEEREYAQLSNEDVAKKTQLILNAKITPIVCVGETKEEYDRRQTGLILNQQLTPILKAVANKSSLVIAYEPRWAIGTGLTPTNDEIDASFVTIQQLIEQKKTDLSYTLLYGGSVTTKSIEQLAQLNTHDGYLIGGASLDFQALKKIIQLSH